jgi:hypothetical protein
VTGSRHTIHNPRGFRWRFCSILGFRLFSAINSSPRDSCTRIASRLPKVHRLLPVDSHEDSHQLTRSPRELPGEEEEEEGGRFAFFARTP